MPPPQQFSRINLTELKAQIVKKLGPEKAQNYFYYLNRLLSQKLSKTEFDKLCYLTIGRENLALHNQFIHSILKNAYQGKVPPPTHVQEVPKCVRGIKTKSSPNGDGYQQIPQLPAQNPLVWSNGDVLPMSPRKGRSGIRDRKLRDRPSPLGPNGKTDLASHQAIGTDEAFAKVTENGDLNLCDLQRLGEHHQGPAEQPETERNDSIPPHVKRPRIKKPTLDLVSVHSKGPIKMVNVEDGEVVEQTDSNSIRSPLTAPLGIPFCTVSVGGARRAPSGSLGTYLLPAISSSQSSSDSAELFDTETLRKRMEQIAEAEGLDGVTMDCANLLNNGLDAYLKRLIGSCVELVGARSGHDQIKHPVYKQHAPGKLTQGINGVWPGHPMHTQNAGGSVEGMQETKSRCPISLLDFKVVMELNPQQLGEDWPLLLEKICLHGFEE